MKSRNKSGSLLLKITRSTLPFILVAAAFFVIYPHLVREWPGIISALKESDKILLIVLLFAQSSIYLFDGTLAYTLLSILERRVRWAHAIRIAILAAISGKILPVVGNTVTTYFLYGKLDVKLREVLFIVFSWNILYAANFMLFFGLALFFAPADFIKTVHAFGFWTAISVFFGIVALLVFLLIKKGKNLIRISKFISGIFGVDINTEDIAKFMNDFYDDIRILSSKKSLTLRALALSCLYYLSSVLILYFSFFVFHYYPSFTSVILGFGFSTILALVTFVPEVPGVTEASMSLVFVTLGYPAHIAVLTSILYRLVSYWVLLPLGAHSYYRLNKEYGIKKRRK